MVSLLLDFLPFPSYGEVAAGERGIGEAKRVGETKFVNA